MANLLANLKDFDVGNAGTGTLKKLLSARSSQTKQGLSGHTRGGKPVGLPESQGGSPVGRHAVTGSLRTAIEKELKGRQQKAVGDLMIDSAHP